MKTKKWNKGKKRNETHLCPRKKPRTEQSRKNQDLKRKEEKNEKGN